MAPQVLGYGGIDDSNTNLTIGCSLCIMEDIHVPKTSIGKEFSYIISDHFGRTWVNGWRNWCFLAFSFYLYWLFCCVWYLSYQIIVNIGMIWTHWFSFKCFLQAEILHHSIHYWIFVSCRCLSWMNSNFLARLLAHCLRY